MTKNRTFELNKLVRDGIVEETEKVGGEVLFSTLSGTQLLEAILEKIDEEVTEFKNAGSREEQLRELADLRDLVDGVANQIGATAEDLDNARGKGPYTYNQGHFILTVTLPEDNEWAQYYASHADRFPEIN